MSALDLRNASGGASCRYHHSQRIPVDAGVRRRSLKTSGQQSPSATLPRSIVADETEDVTIKELFEPYIESLECNVGGEGLRRQWGIAKPALTVGSGDENTSA